MTKTALVNGKEMRKIGNEPVVIFPLKKWMAIENYLDELEDTTRFNAAFQESRGKRGVSLSQLKRRYKLF